MTARKAIDLRRRETRLCRGGRHRPRSLDEPTAEEAISLAIGDAPSAEFAAMMAEQFHCLLDALGDEQLRSLALGKMEGYSNHELAEQLGCSVRTVERRLHLIREKLKRKVRDDGMPGLAVD
jgi:RNA polymerase sigma factor (sigma-70 family)